MGIMKGGLVFLLAILLFISLFLSNLFLILSWSLSYNNVAPYIKNITTEMAQTSGNSGEFLQDYENKRFSCTFQSSINLTLDSEGVTIPCEIINKGSKATLDYAIEGIVPKKYYKSYECQLFACLKSEESELVLVSEHARDYWTEKFKLTFLISLGLFLLIFLSLKGGHSAFTISGIIIILSSLPFKQISWILSIAPEFFPYKALPLFFSKSGTIFILMLITGIIFILVGIGIGFFKWGLKLNGFINSILAKTKKDEKKEKESKEKATKEEIEELVKEEVKEELNKRKNNQSKKKK